MINKRAPHEDSDLVWLFRWSAGAIGFHSSAAYEPGRGSVIGEDRLADVRLTALPGEGKRITDGTERDHRRRKVQEPSITKERRLTAALGKLSSADQRLLWLAYGPHPAPPIQHANALGPWPWLLLASAPVQEGYGEYLAKARTAHAKEADAARAERIGVANGVLEWARAVAAQCRPARTPCERRDRSTLAMGLREVSPDALVDVPGGLVPSVRTLMDWVCTSAERAVLRRGADESRAALNEAHARWVEARGPSPMATAQRTPRHFWFSRAGQER